MDEPLSGVYTWGLGPTGSARRQEIDDTAYTLKQWLVGGAGGVKSHFQLKRAQALVGVSARHRELVDAEFRL